MATTNDGSKLSAAQYSEVRRLLRSLDEHLQMLDLSGSNKRQALEIIKEASLALSKFCMGMHMARFVDIDCQRLGRRSLLVLKRDSAVPISVKREIDLLLKVRHLAGVIAGALARLAAAASGISQGMQERTIDSETRNK
jgi:hypothetical protein